MPFMLSSFLGSRPGQRARLPFLRTQRGLAFTVLSVLLIVGGSLSRLASLGSHNHVDDGGIDNGSLLRTRDSNATAVPGLITDDTYFYGDSPPVYPSPDMTGVGTWAVAYNKAVALVSQMTLAEKVNLTAGVSSGTGCSGTIPGVPRLNFTGMCLSDAGNGLRSTDFVSAWPSGIHVGASWNRTLARQRAIGMAGEFKKKGVNVMLGPVVGPAGRTVRGGRYWEGLSVDPYLAGALVYETVTGTQQTGVITSTKHYIANEQETNRLQSVQSGDVQSVSSNIDDRTMHELYLWPFQDAVLAGSGNIMCSYNRVNNSYGCANSKTLNGLLKTELGFQGFVVTDWGAQHAGVASALAGLDVTMPNSVLWGDNLVNAVKNGSVPESRVTDMATRIVAAWYQMGQDTGIPAPGIGMPVDLTRPHPIVDGRDPAAKQTLLDGAVEGHVLLKNNNHALPLQTPKFLSVFGYSARAADQNNYEGSVSAWEFGAEAANITDILAGFVGSPNPHPLGIAPNGTLFSGGGSGANSLTTASAPFDALTQRAGRDGTQLFWDFTEQNPSVNAVSEACLVFGNVWATESVDRPALSDDYTDQLIANVASKCSNTIVILHNAGVRIVDAWIDHPNVTALLFAHLPGQASGEALVSLLYGDANPSGKLPYTVAKQAADYGAVLDPDLPAGVFGLFPQANFTEGVFVDYRHFDARNITPRYEFGFGLSYTTFAFANLAIQKATPVSGAETNLFAEYPTGAVRQGGQADLWDQLVTVTADVQNTGRVAGAEVAQLYVTLPGAGEGADGAAIPVHQLRGFDKTLLAAGATAQVTFALTRRDLSYWDVVAQKWRLPAGTYTVRVGSSSRSLPLTGTFAIEGGLS
ncbi:hypothetical protein HMPREF1624_05445 [Sporothrix schenckii ATCC 58251]|uniref:beta-glucosidase n=1 Tax=Sporothrix schenckii (strain ATCC 58251 / de Perez 2211183) TaxID=1391915 RepID=U7PSN2_SPOS1|nr:hypothetical protein HMPREF1624_05445 [Sporothrix schenckii ATCC 58251]